MGSKLEKKRKLQEKTEGLMKTKKKIEKATKAVYVSDSGNLEKKRELGSEKKTKSEKENDADVKKNNYKNVDQWHTKVKKVKKSKSDEKKKRRERENEVSAVNEDQIHPDENLVEDTNHEDLDQCHTLMKKGKKSKLGFKKKRMEKENEVSAVTEDQNHSDERPAASKPNSNHAEELSEFQIPSVEGNSKKPKKASKGAKTKTKKIKKDSKNKNKNRDISQENNSKVKVEEEVEEIQLIDEDCSRGMKKWLMKYKEDRPGLKILQERIDDFITAQEERQEQERKGREAEAAEGGWTVVTHHKGRKKTTDTETGVTVGSVAQAAVLDKMVKKISKEVPKDFYRFQKREAQRNEVMMLQSKFEQDKKRIQQMRAARKFRPY